MKLKYYLKGLGTGILFASIILSISFAVHNRQNETKTQDDIIAAALEAGMVWPEDQSDNFEEIADTTQSDNFEEIADITTTPEESTPEESSSEPTSTSESTPEETTPEATTPENQSDNFEEIADTTQSDNFEEITDTTTTKEPETTAEKDLDACVLYKGSDKVRIQILRGMNSYDVAKILEKAGILKGYADREAFNDYLVANGYGGYVMVGVFEIPTGASYDEIISIVCKK